MISPAALAGIIPAEETIAGSCDVQPEQLKFIVELMTVEGRISERYATYEEARRRVDQFPDSALVALPLIFEELADGSERVVRDDGKPLQYHRTLVEDSRESASDPLPLAEGSGDSSGLEGKIREIELPKTEWDDDPIPLV